MADLTEQFKDAFEAHSDELFRHAFLRLSDRERALELTQETFLKAWDYCARGGEIRDFRAFFFRTLRHLIIDEYRKHKAVSLEGMLLDEDDTVERLLPADETNTLEAAIDRFDGKLALEALKELADPYREVLILRYVEGFSVSEIAAHLDESTNATSVRLHRALGKLRDLLKHTL